MNMNGPLEWFGAIGTIVAAALIAADLGRRTTGWAFVLFMLVSIAWIVAALGTGTTPIAIQNAALLIVNGWGAWQYLLNRRKRIEMKIVEAYAEKVHDRFDNLDSKDGQAAPFTACPRGFP